MKPKSRESICNKGNNKYCKDLHESRDGSCVHRKPHICHMEPGYCQTIGQRAKCKEI